MQTRKTPVWKIAFSLGISGLLMLAALGFGWQQIS
jgi:hypothetical protein